MIDIKGLNSEEKRTLQEFQKRLETLSDSIVFEEPVSFYRFLKARDFNLDKAENMIRNHFIWRKANQVDNILEDFEPKEVYHKYIMPSSVCYDKEGDMVIYSPTGKIEGRDMMKCFTINEILKHCMWYLERSEIMHISRMKENKYCQIVSIVDLDKLTLRNTTHKLSVEAMLPMISLLQDHYPEGLKSIYVINAPRYYVIAFVILKTVMSNSTIRKIHVFGQSGWRESLLASIDADVLPAFLGGNKTDPDGNPFCKTFITHGGRIPSCYYMSNEDRYFRDKTQVIKMFVPESSKREVYVDVKEKGLVIHWEFLVKNKDIGFGLFYEKSEPMEVLPVQRYETLDGAQKGFYRTKLEGKYIIVFDNSYSWLSSKEVEYCVKVVKMQV